MPSQTLGRSTFRISRNLLARALEIELPSLYPEDFQTPIYIFQNGATLYFVREDNENYIAGQSLAGENPLLHAFQDTQPPTTGVPYANTNLYKFYTRRNLTPVNPRIPMLFATHNKPLQSPPNQYRTDDTWWQVETDSDAAWEWTGVDWKYDNVATDREGVSTTRFFPVDDSHWVDFKPNELVVNVRKLDNLTQSIHILTITTPLGSLVANPEYIGDLIVFSTALDPDIPDTNLDEIVITHDQRGTEPLQIESFCFNFAPAVAAPPPAPKYKYPGQMMQSTAKFNIHGYTSDRSDVQEAFNFLLSRVEELVGPVTISYRPDRTLFIDGHLDDQFIDVSLTEQS